MIYDDDFEALPVLRMEVGFVGLPEAWEAGRIIDRMANAFSQDAAQRTHRKTRLSVDQLQIGSLLVLFRDIVDFGSGVITLIEHHEILTGFVSEASQVLAGVVGMQINVPPYFRTLLTTLARPVAEARATQVTFNVSGSNNAIFLIDNVSDAAKIMASLAQPQAFRDPRPYQTETAAKLEHPSSTPPFSQATVMAPVKALRRGSNATILDIDGTWYARPEGHQGTMVPVEMDLAAAKLCIPNRYIAEGSVVMSGSNPVGYRLWTAEQI